MLAIQRTPHDTKTYFSHSTLPSYIDPCNTSTKKNPFAAFAALPHAHTLDLLLPAAAWPALQLCLPTRVYARAFLALADVLDDAFLDAYVRNASAAFQIAGGVLRIEMDRPTYERAGLVGSPVEDGGRKHQKNRWVVVCDLRLEAMRRGKRGFERVRWAARNVLVGSARCLFWSANPSFAESVREGREVLCRHAPKVVDLWPAVEAVRGVGVPRLRVEESTLSGLHDQEDALALLEWLDVVSLGSARALADDHVDSHLCRYEVPDFGHGVESRELVRVRWTGFVTPGFVKDVFLAVWTGAFKAKRDANGGKAGDPVADAQDPGAWFAMSAQAFGGTRAWSLMQFASRETLVWEVEG
ncbi:hypothetical protein EJ07DRAFT_169812 [Lizonia empirigonia]|nr:hypothetical protein EJ07DRAFT_169812 [Lizonia empirigonia]